MNKNTFPPVGGKVLGRPVENILLNLNTFKQFCFLASTDYSKKIY